MDENPENGWREYKQRVLYQLDELQSLCNSINEKVDRMKEDVIVLKVKAGLIGGVTGIITSALITLLFKLLTKTT